MSIDILSKIISFFKKKVSVRFKSILKRIMKPFLSISSYTLVVTIWNKSTLETKKPMLDKINVLSFEIHFLCLYNAKCLFENFEDAHFYFLVHLFWATGRE